MKNQSNRLLSLVAFAAVLALGVLTVRTIAHAQTTAPAPAAGALSNVEGPNQSAITQPADTTAGTAGVVNAALADAQAVVGTNSTVARIFAVLATISGFCALTLKPLWDKFVFPALQAAASTTTAGGWVRDLLSNRIFKAVAWAVNLLTHLKVPILDRDGAAVSPSSAGTTLK